ncbi:hypothetical protein KCP74_06195 [Salmonella enterica subsp. enterica]|nr:hypothetical protein KCP74_06195 [Salmonella enterica subsp. enterica]
MDIYAFRVIVHDSIPAIAYSARCSLYKPARPGRVKDYIACHSQANGYRLCTSMISARGVPVEIRSYRRHGSDMAEMGITAAHWAPEHSETGTGASPRWRWMREACWSCNRGAGGSSFGYQQWKSDLFPADEIYVFTRSVLSNCRWRCAPVVLPMRCVVTPASRRARVDRQPYPLLSQP